MEPLPICYDYLSTYYQNLIQEYSVSIVILTINYVLKETVIFLTTQIGFPTKTKLNIKIINYIFFAYLFNTVFVIIAIYKDFGELSSQSKINLGLGISSGLYKDYSPGWYDVVGRILISTMYLKIFLVPIV